MRIEHLRCNVEGNSGAWPGPECIRRGCRRCWPGRRYQGRFAGATAPAGGRMSVGGDMLSSIRDGPALRGPASRRRRAGPPAASFPDRLRLDTHRAGGCGLGSGGPVWRTAGPTSVSWPPAGPGRCPSGQRRGPRRSPSRRRPGEPALAERLFDQCTLTSGAVAFVVRDARSLDRSYLAVARHSRR